MQTEKHFALSVVRLRSSNESLEWRISITRKVARLATERNRWKRRIREVLRSYKNLRMGYRITLRVLRTEKTLKPTELEREIRELLIQSELWN